MSENNFKIYYDTLLLIDDTAIVSTNNFIFVGRDGGST